MDWKSILIVVLVVLFVGSMCGCEDEKEVVKDVGDIPMSGDLKKQVEESGVDSANILNELEKMVNEQSEEAVTEKVAEDVEIKIFGEGGLGYDDGEADGHASLGPKGHAVLFSNAGKQYIYGIRVCGARCDDTTREFDIEIWDNNLKTLYSASYDYTDYFPDTYSPPEDNDLKWVTIDVPNIEVNGDFYITVFSYSGPPSWVKGPWGPHAPKGGIVIGRDSDTKSGNSFVVSKNPNRIEDWETITTWDIRQEDTDWMIRALTAQ